MLLATSCPVCGACGPAPCPTCRRAIRPAPVLPPPPGITTCGALMAYEGVGRELVARLKYANARSSLAWLADGMAALVVATEDVRRFDAVTWVPTTPQRRRQRGFDHGQLLAQAVARRLGRPCRRLLVRLPGPPQTGHSRAERLAGPRLVVAHPTHPMPTRLLIVDDVVTTGATLAAAARTLAGHRADEIHAVVAARVGPSASGRIASR